METYKIKSLKWQKQIRRACPDLSGIECLQKYFVEQEGATPAGVEFSIHNIFYKHVMPLASAFFTNI
jgi:hypothetical protein